MAKRTKSGLSSMSLREIHSELRRRSRRAGTLQRRRDRLAGRLAALDAQIRELGGSAGGRSGPRGPRAKNEKSLADMLADVLSGKTLSVTDAAEAVQQAGYKTNSKSFRVQVNLALLKRKDLFKRMGRGEYTAK